MKIDHVKKENVFKIFNLLTDHWDCVSFL